MKPMKTRTSKWRIVTDTSSVADRTLRNGDKVLVDTSANPATLYLPVSPSIGWRCKVRDYAGIFATNNCTIDRNGKLINGAATNMTVSETGTEIDLVYADTVQGWVSFGFASSLLSYTTNTWTPVLTFATPGDLSVTYSVQVGSYTRIGNRVTAQCNIQTSALTHTTASGALRITGLPYTSNSTANCVNVGSCQYQGITNAATPHVVCIVDPNVTRIEFRGSGSGTGTITIDATHVPTGGTVILICTIEFEI